MVCKQHFSKIKYLLLLENYDHIMCKSIRLHKHKKQFESLGAIDPQKAAELMY